MPALLSSRSSVSRSFYIAVCFGLSLFLLSGCGGGSVMANNTMPGATPTPTVPAATPTPTASSNSCPTIPVQEAAGPQSGVAPFPSPAPEPPPSPGTTANGSVCVSMPADGASVTSPVHVYAQASLVNPIDHARVYVDGTAEYFTFFNTVDAQMSLANGTHTLEVLATDKNGNDVSTTFQVNVVPPQAAGIDSIQNLPGWEPCSALFPPGDPRAGQICAAGIGNAVSTMTEDQSSPSLSGSSAKFTMGGPTGYSNELYTKFLGGGTNVSNFVYDLNFMVDNPHAPQALEFDVNQTFGNNRWVFGTECNFNGNKVNGAGEWDVWDGVNGWQPTTVPCLPSNFPANTWNHLVWTFQRVGSQVKYVSLQVNGQTYNLNLLFSNQPNWTMEDIDVAFQMDGNSTQEPYTVWLDNVTLQAN